MTAELWRLTMETGEVVDVIVANISDPKDVDQYLFRHVPKHTTIHTRELLSRHEYVTFSYRVERQRVE